MRLQFQRVFAGVVFLLVFALAGCQATTAATNTSSTAANVSSTNNRYPPANVHYNADRWEFTTPQSMCSAILTAEVKGVTHGSSFWNSPDGLRPYITTMTKESVSQTISEQGYHIYTSVQFGTMKIFKDRRQQPTKKFLTVGGQVQQDQIWSEPFPQLKNGDHYLIVFAPGVQPLSKGKVAEWLTVYNAFPIDTQGMVILQQAGSPNEPGSGTPASEVKISLTDLQMQLAACK